MVKSMSNPIQCTYPSSKETFGTQDVVNVSWVSTGLAPGLSIALKLWLVENGSQTLGKPDKLSSVSQ